MGAGVRDAFPPLMCVVDCLRVPFGWIARKWLFGLCGIAWKNITERGRGGACVPTRVALQGRIHRSFLVHDACILGMETPLRGRSGGHIGTAPTVSFGQIAFGWFCLLVGENGAHEPTPSVLYFCQPRVADERRLPWVKSPGGNLCHRHCTF